MSHAGFRTVRGAGLLAVGFAVLTTISGAPPPLVAQAEAHAEGGHGHLNTLSVFLGPATRFKADNPTDLALGFEYARSVTNWLKIGALLEFIPGETNRDRVIAMPFFLHLTRSLLLVAGPGVERSVPREDGVEPAPHSSSESGEAHNAFLFRFGVDYEIGIGSRFVLAPQINADVAGGHWTLVYGAAFGIAF